LPAAPPLGGESSHFSSATFTRDARLPDRFDLPPGRSTRIVLAMALGRGPEGPPGIIDAEFGQGFLGIDWLV
jgi:hypothetical protein